MLFKGSIITAASGKFGGLVASHNSGGQYIRQFAVPTDPNTPLQQARKAAFGMYSNRWTTILTAAQRSAWNAIAGTISATNALGDPIQLSGQQAYVRAATITSLTDLDPPDDPPTITGETNLGELSNIAVSSAVPGVSFDVGMEPPWAGDDDGRILAFLGRGVSVATNFYRGPFQFMGTFDGDGTTPITAGVIVNATGNFAIVAGLKYFVRFRAYLGGQLSQDEIVGRIAT